MAFNFNFEQTILDSVVGGKSAIDIPRLNIHDLDKASEFIKTYGFDISKEEDLKKLWYFHRRALVLIQENLLLDGEKVPEEVADQKQIGDIRNLLILASHRASDKKDLQRWACAVLRVMHVFVHAESDLFGFYSEEIQRQILTPIQDCIAYDGSGRTFLRTPDKSGDQIELCKFEVKSFKMSTSTVIKLLAKSDMLAVKIYDKIGVRFVTKSKFDAFRILVFLTEHNLISFPHVMPDQSSNTLYPADLFFEVISGLKKSTKNHFTDQEIEEEMNRVIQSKKDVAYVRKENTFSGENYRFIKFITRKMIHIPGASAQDRSLSFFYPFEVQIIDEESHRTNVVGAEAHDQYKVRQKMAARRRVFVDLNDA